jgi:hypothetical protein
MKPDRNALILTVSPEGEIGFRPALFVFTTPDGFAWVEPSYLEPIPAPQPAFHRVTGEVVMGAGEVSLDTAENWQFTAAAYEGEILALDRDGSIGAALAWAAQQLADQGATMDEERERLKAELADDLA